MTTKKKPEKLWLAIDHYGNREWIRALSPRAELLRKTGKSRAVNMYRDGPDGSPQHVGYIIGDQWFSVFQCIPLHDAKNT